MPLSHLLRMDLFVLFFDTHLAYYFDVTNQLSQIYNVFPIAVPLYLDMALFLSLEFAPLPSSLLERCLYLF